MKTSILTLFLHLAVSGAWASFPLPYFHFDLLPPPHNFIHHPHQIFEPFFDYPQFGGDFIDTYEPLSYIEPESFNYYEYPPAPKYHSYSEWIPQPKISHNPVAKYIYQQFVQHPAPSSVFKSTINQQLGPQVFYQVTEQPETEKMPNQPVVITDNSKTKQPTTEQVNPPNKSQSQEVTMNSIKSMDNSKPQEVAASPMNSSGTSKPQEPPTNPTNSVPKPQPMETAQPKQGEASAAKSMEAPKPESTLPKQKTETGSTTKA